MRRAWLVGLALVAGCLGPRSDSSSFYVLSATVSPQQATALPVVLGIGPVVLPGYLDRPQIVERVSENELAVAETDRWAEPLRDIVPRTLRENLRVLLPGSSYVTYPWFESEAPAYGIAVEVHRFEADASGGVVLHATWEIVTAGEIVERGDSRIPTAVDGATRSATVAAQSRALAELSREIAAGVRRAEALR